MRSCQQPHSPRHSVLPVGLGFLVSAWTLGAASWVMDGIVVSSDPESRELTVAHRPVPKVMPAMTMPFRTRQNIDGIQPGMRIRFRFDGKTASRIRRVPPDEAGMPAPERTLRSGDIAPDFELTGQNGEPVRLSSLRETPVLLNFLYTRCPVPEVCPRLAAAFAFVHRKYGGKVHLISITVDPVWDTPAVLAAYAKLWRARASSWHFLTGAPERVAETGRAYGLVYWPDEGVVAHTARTYVIGRDGKIGAVLEGTSWRPDQLSSLVDRQLER